MIKGFFFFLMTMVKKQAIWEKPVQLLGGWLLRLSLVTESVT
jgi:hypothetical protein